MRSEVFSFVALSMALACSDVTEPTQANDAVGGTSGVGGSVSTDSDRSTANGGSEYASSAASGGRTSALTSAAPTKPGSGGASTESDNSAVGGAPKSTSSMGGAKSTATKPSAGSPSVVGSTNAVGTKSTGGAKSSGTVKGGGGNKNPASTRSSGGNASAAGGSNSTRTTSARGGAGAGGNSSTGSASAGCDRAGLQAAVDAYLAALESKDTSKMPLSSSVKYTEVAAIKGSTTNLEGGLWQTAQPVAFSRSLLDVTGCETFTEVFITETSHPYALGTRLAVSAGEITEIYTIATDSDDWNFDATAYAKCSESEDWSELPEASRSTREVLIAAGQAYFDIFSDKSTEVPWGTPCYRLEGGKGCTPAMDKASKSCNVGIPDGITFTKTHWVVDVDIGAVVGITLFGGADPDTHLFRLVDGKIRYVHTLTVMK